MSWPVAERRGQHRVGRRAGSGAASLVYGLGARIVKTAHDRGWLPRRRASLPVVSVGALTVGGAGKTPFVRWLAGSLGEAGRRPAILSRGYRAEGGTDPRVVDPAAPDAVRDGDEPALLARSLPDVPVVVGPDRLAGATLAVARGADLLLLDDGFQHRRLHRDLDIVLWDRASEVSEGRLLPSGFLREPLSALVRADVLVLVDRGDGFPDLPRDAPERHAHARLRTAACQEVPEATSVHALSGLADPESFERALQKLGLRVTGATRYPDHHAFTFDQIREVARRASREQADIIAITAKDWMRWPTSGRTELPVPAVFDLEVSVEPADLVDEIAAIGGKA